MIVKFNKNIKYIKFTKSFMIKGKKKNWAKITSLVILRASSFSFLKLKEIESSRRFLKKFCKKKKGKLFIRVIPYQILTYKSIGVRMGKGKGKKIRDRFCRVRPGQVIFEFEKNIKKVRLNSRIFIGRICRVFFLLKKKLSFDIGIYFKGKK